MCNLFFVLYHLFYLLYVKKRTECYIINTPTKYHKFALKPINYRFILERRIPKNPISFRPGKVKLVQSIKEQLRDTKVLLQFRLFSITHPMRQYIKDNLVSNIEQSEDNKSRFKLQVVKNTLMKIAVSGTEFEPLTPKMVKTNLYIFVYDDLILPKLMSIINGFRQASQVIKSQFVPSYACFCGRVAESYEMRSLSSIPEKKELMARIAQTLNYQYVKLATSLDLPSRILNSISAMYGLNPNTTKDETNDQAQGETTGESENT